MFRRVHVTKFYRYEPAGMDIWDGPATLEKGDIVQVRNLPGCPKAGTMGHCYVFKDGKFAGMVLVNSLADV